jgi:hypothetical protein
MCLPEGWNHIKDDQHWDTAYTRTSLPAANTGPHSIAVQLQRQRTVRLGDVVNELHDEHRLAHPSTTKQADLATTLVWRQEVHDLCSKLKHPVRRDGCSAIQVLSLLQLVSKRCLPFPYPVTPAVVAHTAQASLCNHETLAHEHAP